MRRGLGDVDNNLKENFGEVKAKNSSKEALQRERKMRSSEKYRKRARSMVRRPKRSEVPAMGRAISVQSYFRPPKHDKAAEKLGSIVERQDEKKLTSHGGFEGIADKLSASEVTAGPSDYKLPEDVEAAGYQSCAEELESIVEGHDEKKLKSHGGVEGIADKLSTSEVTAGSIDYEVPEDVEAAGFQSCAEELESIFEGHDQKKLRSHEKKLVIRNGFEQKLSTHDLLPGDIVHLNIGDQVPAGGLFITGGSLPINLSSLTGDCKPVHASGVGIPFLLHGKAVQYLITQDACEPCSNDSAAPDDLIHQLVRNLNSCCPKNQKEAALKIRRLTKNNPENRVRIAQAGAIKPLIILISSSDPEVQEQSVTSILNLLLCDENKELIAGSGAIKPLVRALRTGTATAKENAACALLRLSQIEENKVAIGRSGAIPLLVNLLESGGSQGKKDTLAALWSLCSAEENKVRVVKAGAIRPLVGLMADLESSTVNKAAGMLVSMLAEAALAEVREALVDEGLIPVLVKLVERGTPGQKNIAVEVLLQLCKDSVVSQMVVQAGGWIPLMVLAGSSANPVKQTAEKLKKLLRQSMIR